VKEIAQEKGGLYIVPAAQIAYETEVGSTADSGQHKPFFAKMGRLAYVYIGHYQHVVLRQVKRLFG